MDNVTWQLNTKDNYIINSTPNIQLPINENITVYVEYEFSTQGDFNVTAINGSLKDSINYTFT